MSELTKETKHRISDLYFLYYSGITEQLPIDLLTDEFCRAILLLIGRKKGDLYDDACVFAAFDQWHRMRQLLAQLKQMVVAIPAWQAEDRAKCEKVIAAIEGVFSGSADA